MIRNGILYLYKDSEILVDILFKFTLDEMEIIYLSLKYTNTFMKRFEGGRLTLLGFVELFVTINSRPFEKIIMLDFMVVEENSLYHVIFVRPFMRIKQSVMFTH